MRTVLSYLSSDQTLAWRGRKEQFATFPVPSTVLQVLIFLALFRKK